MEIIETKIYEPVPDKPHFVREVGRRKAIDVFKELEERLRQLGLYPDEYFLLATEFEDENALFPEAIDICCFAQWGNSEGIYLEVNLVTAVDGKCVRKNFATGKTLADDSNAFDRMQYTAGYIYKLFCGTHNVSPRFILVRKNEKPTRELLFARVELEYREYLKQILVHKQARISDNGMDIGLRSMIISELPKCLLPEDKIQELMSSDNALDLLTKICQPVLEPNSFEINDMISSCRTFAGELAGRASDEE